MRPLPLIAFLAAAAATGAASGGETVTSGAAPAGATSDPCGFYRSQAYGRGLAHYATDMLWACETITARRWADMTLGARLEAVDLALERYRAAVVAAGVATFATGRAAGPASGRLGADDEHKAALAESSGALTALEAVRGGF
jgi:hypothetical protein